MRVLGVVGRVLIGTGIFLLLFAAYLVWGTALQQAHTQSLLRNTLVHAAQSTQVRHALAGDANLDTLPTGPPVVAPTTAAPPEGAPVGEIRIPAMGIDQVIVSGTQTQDLRQGPGHYTGTPLPGQAGNSGVAGHRTTYGHPFYSLSVLKVGDPVVLTTVQGVFVYDTTAARVVPPSDTSVLANAPGAWVTLTTCNPRFSASSRLVVTAKLAHSRLFAGPASPEGTPSFGSARPPARAQGPGVAGARAADLAGRSDGQPLRAVLWGVAVAAFGTAVVVADRRYRHRRRIINGVGAVLALGLLYFFFAAISPLLPASM